MIGFIIYIIGAIITFAYFEKQIKEQHVENPDYSTVSIISTCWPIYWIAVVIEKILN